MHQTIKIYVKFEKETLYHTSRISLITIVVCCLAASLVKAYPSSYYRPYYHERSSYITKDTGDGPGFREYDESGHHQRQQSQASHGNREYEDGESHSLRDRVKKEKHDQGSHSSVHNSGGKKEHAKKSHDKAFYEKEKKYGYEKSYGYERETKSHDKGSTSHEHNSGYEHNENKRDHKRGEQFLRDLADDGKNYKHGSESHGKKQEKFESSSHHNIGKDIVSELDKEFRHPHFNFHKRSGPISDYSPNFVPKEYMFGVENALQRFKYLSGIHGLGGIRTNLLSYGYNPLRYRYLENHFERKLLPADQLYFDIEHPSSRVIYLDSEV
ncbi:uncharacterized protein TNIN_494121 [Trichonephila inaurata madagascariensis]|uniref:Uncharacterized protein n=1 Tax=Trichonephila inaurata madagascariensis TaxID=2747483 RepID=A0A8X6YI99_9ARAC|nr:uncharacterized protein TNIN_494121 [Trichonephila inaurata madagascariensis]